MGIGIGRRQRYGLTPEDVEAMLEEQGGLCSICREPARLCVDHCHETGRVRGLLCWRCNTHLSSVEKPGWLEAALSYLEEV